MSELYNTAILRYATNIPHTDRLTDPSVSVMRVSRICGSKVTVDLTVTDGAISDYGQEVKACALGQASCAVVGKHVLGETLESFAPVADAMRAMLKGEGPAPGGKWMELEMFTPAIEHKSRHGSILLPFEAIMEGFQKLGSGL